MPQIPGTNGFGNGEVSVAAPGADPGTTPGLFNPKNSSPNLHGDTPDWPREFHTCFPADSGNKGTSRHGPGAVGSEADVEVTVPFYPSGSETSFPHVPPAAIKTGMWQPLALETSPGLRRKGFFPFPTWLPGEPSKSLGRQGINLNSRNKS